MLKAVEAVHNGMNKNAGIQGIWRSSQYTDKETVRKCFSPKKNVPPDRVNERRKYFCGLDSSNGFPVHK
jgi:hypothetical protein